MTIRKTIRSTIRRPYYDLVKPGSGLSQFDELAPSALTLTVLSETSIKLDWTNNSVDAMWVSIERSTDGVTYAEIATVSAATSTYEDATGIENTRYYYRLKAYRGTTYSAASTAANDWTAIKMVLTSTGTGAGVSTIAFWFDTTNVVATLDGAGKWYSDTGGTADEAASYTFVAGALNTRYLKVTSGTSNMLIFAKGNLSRFGDNSKPGWVSSDNAAIITVNAGSLKQLSRIRIIGSSVFTGSFADSLSTLNLIGADIYWSNSSALPASLTYVSLSGNNLNWTGLSVGETGAITTLTLTNYRTAKMSSADMVTLLTQMTNRAGTLPATITINDYADYASPPQEVTNAVALLKSTKSITTVNLGA